MTVSDFIELLALVVERPNPEQEKCLAQGLETPTFIVAGPGSGKTRVLVQRALRHVLVDELRPEQIVITTFTVKAAKEIRSRLVEWGEPLIDVLRQRAAANGDFNLIAYLDRIDVNRFVTGTLDSLCEEAIEVSRAPAERRFTLLDEFASRTQLARQGRLYEARNTQPELDRFLSAFTLDGEPPNSNGDAARDLKQVADRLIHDLVEERVFSDGTDRGRLAALEVVQRYWSFLAETGQLDFAQLERTIRDRIRQGRDVGQLSGARAVLVDEYQDTNLLQEQIYFELVRRQHAALTVVGDDDQSLYRFRGATIELFRDFAARAQRFLACPPITPIYLYRNYRSTTDIIGFLNRFVTNDPDFNPDARVQPLKPPIEAANDKEPFPILGIFREDYEELAPAVVDFLEAVFVRGGQAIPELPITLRGAVDGGDFGDAVLLAKSVNEFGRSFRGKPPNRKFPYFLRAELEARGHRVFNPRGRPLREIPALQQLLGLVLETLDPSAETGSSGPIERETLLRNEVRRVFAEWRSAARGLMGQNPTALDGKTLRTRLGGLREKFLVSDTSPREWPLLDAVYAFVPFIRALSDDPEHQAYMEAVSRAAAQMVSFSSYRGLILRTQQHNGFSIQAALRDMLAPIAEGDIDLDEEVFADVPRNCFNMMTIHQAKGLEFPLVLVDVSSECKADAKAQRFKRFPDRASGTAAAEDAFADFTEIGNLRRQRTALQRSFEDIIREYYVAYSRPQSVLVLLGNLKALRTKTNIKHIGHFWRSDKTWPWVADYPARRPPPLAACPFVRL